MKKRINSMEIARLAGVSRSTVSRVINGYENVPEETRERVMKVINEQNYYPQLSGQLLVGKGTRTIGFFWVSGGSIANDLQCSAFFVHVTEIAAALGYLVLTCIVKNLRDEDNIQWIKRIFMQGRVDAGIFIGVNNNEPLIEELLGCGRIVGIFDMHRPDLTVPNLVTVNFEENTGEKAIDLVCGMGHRRIAVLDGNMNRYSSVRRHESFMRGLQKHRIEIRREWMRYADVTEDGGYQATRELLACGGELPTVICANNDSAAFGAYRALAEAGVPVPERISVVGIDGHEGGKLTQPTLTTFAFDFERLFRSLVSRTISVVEGRADVPQTEFFESTLVERNSCRRIAPGE